jgi:hypothetical protein
VSRLRFLAIYVPCALSCWLIGYGVGVKNGTWASAVIGWGGGLLLTYAVIYLWGRRRSYEGAIRVERYRKRAEALRHRDPELHAQIVAQADEELRPVVDRDPDAYVALFLAASDDHGASIDSADAYRVSRTAKRGVRVSASEEDVVYQAVRQFLIEDEWPFDEDPERRLFFSSYKGENSSPRVMLYAKDGDVPYVVVYSVLRDQVPEEARATVAQFLVRCNYRYTFGSLDLDFEDGELRCRTAVDVTDTVESLTHDLMKWLVYNNVHMLDQVYPGLMAVIHGGRTPEEADQLVTPP